MEINDPLEKLLAGVLPEFEHERNGLDFYLKAADIYIEVKQFHTDRASDQLKRAQDEGKSIILCQGREAVEYLASLFKKAV